VLDLVPLIGRFERPAMNAGARADGYAAASARRRSKRAMRLPLATARLHPVLAGWLLFRKPAKGTSAARLWASHRSKIEVGGCTDCVLAATTTAASSAILRFEHERERSRS
jgi:hypothetical protein